ncbi:MAG: hypothetical protein WC850_01210 [Candidatus Gracilibacteria bacterium]
MNKGIKFTEYVQESKQINEQELLDVKKELELYLVNHDLGEEIKIKVQSMIFDIDNLIKLINSKNKGKNESEIKLLLKKIKKTLEVLKKIFLTIDDTCRKVNHFLDTVSSNIGEIILKVDTILFH